MACIVTFVSMSLNAESAFGLESLSNAVTSRTARQTAINSIPYDELTAKTQKKLIQVLNKPTLYRRLPIEQIECDPELYLFLVRYPEVVVDIWRLMGATHLGAQRTGPYSMQAKDGAGTTCNVELVYGTADTHIFYADGAYTGSMVPGRLQGRAVLILHSDYKRGPTGRTIVTNQLDVFVQIDNGAIDLVARTLSPLMGKSADLNFVESTRFLSRLSNAAERNGSGVAMMSYRMTGVDANVRSGFAKMAEGVQSRTAQRTQSASAISTRRAANELSSTSQSTRSRSAATRSAATQAAATRSSATPTANEPVQRTQVLSRVTRRATTME